MSAVPPKFTPPVSDKLTPQETAIHLRQLYLALNQHDQAIVQVNSKATGTATASSTTSSASVAGVTSFNAATGGVSYFPSLGLVNDCTGLTAYTVQSNDAGSMIQLNDAGAIAVTLDSSVVIPWFAVIVNQGAGLATLTPTTGLINGAASMALSGGGFTIVFFDGANWEAGTTQSGTVTQIVAGTNVTISPPGGTGAVTINAAAISGPNFADNEVPAGAINGINVTYTLAHAPSPAASLILSATGLIQAQGGGLDYTLAGNTITFLSALTLGPLLAWYRY